MPLTLQRPLPPGLAPLQSSSTAPSAPRRALHPAWVVALVSLTVGPAGAAEGQPVWKRLALPGFILAFLGVVTLNSMVALPTPLTHACLTASKTLLLLAVTATAMRSRMDLLLEMGWRATVPVITATLASFAASLGFALLLLG